MKRRRRKEGKISGREGNTECTGKKSRERKRERRLIKVAGKKVMEYEKSRGKRWKSERKRR